jgi:hypothetical protein
MNISSADEHIRLAQPHIINASKKLLIQHRLEMTPNTIGINIKTSALSAHKQLFSILLKQTWEKDDIYRLMGYCALMQLMCNVKTKTLLPDHKIASLIRLGEVLWEHIQNERDNYTKSVKSFHVFDIDNAFTFDCPQAFIKQLSQPTLLVRQNTGDNSFSIDHATYHTRVNVKPTIKR